MSDDDDAQVYPFPGGGDPSYVPPPIPNYADTLPPPRDTPEDPPEESTTELPRVPSAPDPAATFSAEGIQPSGDDQESDEETDGEYEHRRSFADRIGDWLEYRVEKGRTRSEEERQFREAELARKVALIAARTDRDVAMIEANGKLRQARVKGRADRAGARGKSETGGSRGNTNRSGPGGGKGGPKTPGGSGATGARNGSGAPGGGSKGRSGGARPGGGTGGTKPPSSGKGPGGKTPGSGSPGPKTQGPKPPGSGPGKGNSGGGNSGKPPDGTKTKGGTKGSGKPSSGRNGGDGSKDPFKGSKAPQKGPDGSGNTGGGKNPGAKNGRSGPTPPAGARKNAGVGKNNGGKNAGAGGPGPTPPAGGRKNAGVGKNGGPGATPPTGAHPGGKNAGGEPGGPGPTLLGGARKNAGVGKNAGGGRPGPTPPAGDRPGRKNRGGKNAGGGAPGPTPPAGARPGRKNAGVGGGTGATPPGGGTDPGPSVDWDAARRAAEAVDRGDLDEAKRIVNATTDPSGTAFAAYQFLKDSTPADSPSGKDDTTEPDDPGPSLRDRFKQWLHDLTDKSDKRQDEPEEPTGPVTPESLGWTWEQLPQPERPPRPEEPEHREPAGALAPGPPAPPALPPAPEPHTQRPGTTSPTRENSVSSTQVASAQTGLAAQHRTDTTFDDFLTQIANIAAHATTDQEQQHELSDAVGRAADAVREMAGDLVGDHNITTVVAKLLADLADAAGQMKLQAQRSSEACGQAAEAGRLTAKIVARVYSADMNAKHDAGLQHASAAAHHA